MRSTNMAQKISYDKRPPPGIHIQGQRSGKGKQGGEGQNKGKGGNPNEGGRGGGSKGKKGRSRSPRKLASAAEAVAAPSGGP